MSDLIKQLKKHKLIVKGTYLSFFVIEFNQAEAMYLENIMEKELITYGKIFFERKAYKKLGYKTLEELPVVGQISGFLSHPSMLKQYPTGEFTYIKNNKKVFVSAVERLETKYHSLIFKELCDINSTIRGNEVNFKKKRACKYFFLKKVQSGTFSVDVKDTFQLNQLLFKHCVHHFKRIYFQPVQLLKIEMDDAILEFSASTKSASEMSIFVIK